MPRISNYTAAPVTEKSEENPEKKELLNPRQIKLIRENWSLVVDKKQEVGVALFMRLFEISPKLKALFPFDANPESHGLRAHALNVVETVGAAVDNLDDLEVLKPELDNLGKAHAPFELSTKEYEVVGQALLDTLQGGLGNLFTEEAKAAWTEMYHVIATTMRAAYE